MNFKYRDLNIYYEIHGEGMPLLILNGIMMTTKSWETLLPPLTKQNQVILLDLLDQGQTDSMDSEYKQEAQVELIKAFLDELGIDKVNLFGISYGGEVALQFIVKYEGYVNQLILANTCASTNYWLEEVGKSWKESMHTPLGFYLATIPLIYSPHFFNERKDWMENRKELLVDLFGQPHYLERMKRLINSAEGYDVRSQLRSITCPTFIIGAEHDRVTPIDQQIELKNNLPQAHFVVIPECGHAAMYEKPNEFLSILLGFIQLPEEIVI